MKKIINKLVFCLICFSCNAFADEFIYGKLVAGFQNNQQQNTSIDVRSGVVDYGSYFGIHGHEQLTEQTLFIWQVEQFLDISSGQSYNITTAGGLIMPRDNTSNGMPLANINQLATSDSYIGIQSSWGSIKLGNLSSYLRANMGAVDVFNYGNSSNGLNIWSRTSNNMVLPSSFFYNSSIWNGFTLGFQYSYTNAFNLGPNFDNSLANNGTGNNGYYSDGIFSFGLAWTHGNFKINYGAQLWPKVGAYNGQYLENTIQPVGSNAQYDNAYVNRLEVSYNDPDGIFMAIGAQVTSGLGWYGWANSGGSFNNYIVNSGFN
ncbi:MAG: porin, partial [Neisseriaceae bacterium]